MNSAKSFLIIVLILILGVLNINALHIIGGDAKYSCVGGSIAEGFRRFDVTFTVYRDSRSGGANYDSPARFGIYRRQGDRWVHVRTFQVQVMNIVDIPTTGDNPCILIPVNVGVQRGEYNFRVDLEITGDDYMIAYQRCCRNNTILNLIDPGGTGAAFNLTISSRAIEFCNNSPVFTNFPPVVICVNRSIDFDHSATDMDGDSLVYEFCSPVTAGGTAGATSPGDANACNGVTPNPANCLPPFQNVQFAEPRFTPSAPMAGDPVVTIDPMTGMITGVPTIIGQFVVGVCVKEYRNGELIGEYSRDFQFNVTTCETAVLADVQASLKTESEFIINSCGLSTINFRNLSTDTRFIRNYHWEFDINGTKETYTTRNVTKTFPGLGTYDVLMILNKDLPAAAACSDTALITVNIYPDIDANFTYSYDTCVAGPIAFIDESESGAGSIDIWNWNFIEGISSEENPFFEFETPGNKTVRLIVEDRNECKDTSLQIIPYFPVPSLIVIEPSVFTGCQPATITFDNLSDPIDDTYIFNWNFGDGGTSNDRNPSHTFEDVGRYNVTLEMISPIGCEIVRTWPSLINIVQSPQAGFTFSPEAPDYTNNVVDFIDQSVGAIGFQWKFDTLGVSLLRNPTFTFRDTGVFNIVQIVRHESGCADTANTIIPIRPVPTFFVPNAFTPNSDGLNDIFVPVGDFFGATQYDFTIWNRWGERVYQTSIPEEGWNGQRNNVGEISPPGVYAYVIKYVDGFGLQQNISGHCTLVR